MPSFTIDTFRNMLRVNKHRLDDELELQSSLMDQISSHVARLNAQQLEAKEQLTKVEAELFSDLKSDKVANELANAEVRKNRERQTAWFAYQTKRQEYEEWLGLLNAWTARGYHIKVLADLYVAQYFTVSSTTSKQPDVTTTRAAMREANERVSRIINEELPDTTPRLRRRPLA